MFWRRFDKHKPPHDGWYQCTVAFPSNSIDGKEDVQSYVMDLYWYEEHNKWMDNRRQDIFSTYEVYGYGNGNKKKRLYSNNLCDRTSGVIAWRPLPKPFKITEKIKNKILNAQKQ